MTPMTPMTESNLAPNRATSPWRTRLWEFPLTRIAVALAFVALPFAAVAIPLNLFVTDKSLKRLGALLLAAVVVLAYCAYVRLIEKRRATEFSTVGAVREVAVGVLMGAVLFGLTIGTLAAVGAYHVTGSNGWQAMLPAAFIFLVAAVAEEVAIRAIVFRLLEAALGAWIALALSAALFGLLHLGSPGATWLTTGAISIEAGVLLAAAYLVTRRLWLCIGIHFAWNFAQGGVFSVAVSGNGQKGWLQSALAGPDWLTGGSFGPEGSVVALLVCSAAGGLLLWVARRRGRIVHPGWKRRP